MTATTPAPDTGPAAETRPPSYRMVVPPGWWRIDLEPDRRNASIAALAKRQFQGTDNLPHIRSMLSAEIGRQAEDAFRAGGIEMYLSIITAGPVPVSSSLVVSLVPTGGGESSRDELQALAEELSRSDDPQMRYDASELVDLASGPAVRRTTYLVGSGMSTPENPVGDSCGVDWFVPVPNGNGAMLLLSFSSPLVMIREDITGLFDAVASTLSWG